MKKKAIIVDLDGTLYFQKPVQLCMGFELCFYYILHIYKWREFLILLKYRKQHNLATFFNIKQFALLNNISVSDIKKLVNLWLILKPLKWIKLFADYRLIKILRQIQKQMQVIVYSDYPTLKKLDVLNFKPNAQFFYDNQNILFLKPNPQGLKYIMQTFNIQKEEILIIGDRKDKDGTLASICGVDYIILSANPLKRIFQRENIINTALKTL